MQYFWVWQNRIAYFQSHCIMIFTNQIAYFKRSALFLKMTKSFSLLSVAYKLPIDWSILLALNTISNRELSDPLCDSVNRGLTLVRLIRTLTFGVYQLQMSPSYIQKYLEGDVDIFIHKKLPWFNEGQISEPSCFFKTLSTLDSIFWVRNICLVLLLLCRCPCCWCLLLLNNPPKLDTVTLKCKIYVSEPEINMNVVYHKLSMLLLIYWLYNNITSVLLTYIISGWWM